MVKQLVLHSIVPFGESFLTVPYEITRMKEAEFRGKNTPLKCSRERRDKSTPLPPILAKKFLAFYYSPSEIFLGGGPTLRGGPNNTKSAFFDP